MPRTTRARIRPPLSASRLLLARLVGFGPALCLGVTALLLIAVGELPARV
jgi:hypothetical protein